MATLNEYTCCRCNFKTIFKGNMRKHLICRKRPCIPSSNNIELTPDIVDYILDNRVYNADKQSKQISIKSNINTINTINTNSHNTINHTTVVQYFIQNLDPVKKMEYHQEFINNANPQSIEDLISDKYEIQREDMLSGSGNYLYSFEDFINMVKDVSKMKDINEFKDCVLIDKRGTDQTICYNESSNINPAWQSFESNTLAKFLVNKLQEQFLKNYECYLIRKIKYIDDNVDDVDDVETKQILIIHLDIYYEFISIFDLVSWVFESTTDSQILFNSYDDQYDSISSGTRLVSKYVLKFKKIVQETNSNTKSKTRQRLMFECFVRENSINTHDKFDEKLKNDFVKNSKYIDKMKTRFLKCSLG